MARFSPEAQAKLLENTHVLRITDGTITYSPEFKVEAVRANLKEGKPARLIFVEAGFDLDLIGEETPRRCLKRWRAVFQQRGEEGLRDDRRGRNATGRPLERELSTEEKLSRAEARIKYLELENEFLKKLDAMERKWLEERRGSTR